MTEEVTATEAPSGRDAPPSGGRGQALRRLLPAGRVKVLATHITFPRFYLALLMIGYTAFFTRFTLQEHAGFGTTSFDLGIFDQGMWLLSRLKTPFVTLLGLHLFGDHASFILLFLVPLYWLWPSAAVPLVAQTLALGLAALPVFLLGRRLLGNEWAALLLAAAYLLNPAVAFINLEDFHPDAFEVPLILFAVYFAVARRWKAFAVALVLLLLVKEDTALVATPLGLWVALRHHPRIGLAVAAGSTAWLALAIWVIGPAFSEAQAGALDAWRIPFGGPGGLLQKTVTEPWEVGGYALTAEKQKYLWQLFLPLGLLPLLSPFTLVVLPALSFNLLSTFPYQYWLEYHYTSPVVPLLTAGAVFAIARFPRVSVRVTLAACVLGLALFAAYEWGPSPWSKTPFPRVSSASPEARAARSALALIPPDAVVSGRFNYTPHLAHREKVYDFPNPWIANYWGDDSKKGQRLPEADTVEYVIEFPAHTNDPATEALRQLPAEGFSVIFEEAGVVLWKRESPPRPVPAP